MGLLSENPETFMWVSLLPERLLRQLRLARRDCAENRRMYRDMLIHRQDYQLTELDKRFITELTLFKRACIKKIIKENPFMGALLSNLAVKLLSLP